MTKPPLDGSRLQLVELNHRVANHLHIAAGFLAMQEQNLDGAGREALAQARMRISSIARFHYLIARTGEGAYVNLLTFLQDLGEEISAGLTLDCQVDGCEIQIPAPLAMSLGLVIDELAINARKHAYPGMERGVLRVRLDEDGEDGLRIGIGDDGPGLCAAAPKDSGGLGRLVVEALVREMSGEMFCEGGEQGGAQFVIRIPRG